ncbi:hypothetical protein BXY82_1176 [Gelidibacter sediminis]|uniref:Uncharacterized protein n=1 Tax=Gelidibacter sediminis TaxID=1608710 RepID=A0A4R7Q858_9FLAO|nr:hypothetical protein BXY82_1176 [Gelidibacter sediminis]
MDKLSSGSKNSDEMHNSGLQLNKHTNITWKI